MKINIEDFRRSLNKLIGTSEPIEVYRRGKLVWVVQPVGSNSEPVGSRPNETANLKVQSSNLEVQSPQPVGSRLEVARQALKDAEATTNLEVQPEVRIWIEDGIEHRVTKDMMQRRFGKAWPTFWKQSQPTITH